jgi:hypothetical protein
VRRQSKNVTDIISLEVIVIHRKITPKVKAKDIVAKPISSIVPLTEDEVDIPPPVEIPSKGAQKLNNKRKPVEQSSAKVTIYFMIYNCMIMCLGAS